MRTALWDAKPREERKKQSERQVQDKMIIDWAKSCRTGKIHQYCWEDSFSVTFGTMPWVTSRAYNSCWERNTGKLSRLHEVQHKPAHARTFVHISHQTVTLNEYLRYILLTNIMLFLLSLFRVLKASRLIECWTFTNCLLLIQTKVSDMKHDGDCQW